MENLTDEDVYLREFWSNPLFEFTPVEVVVRMTVATLLGLFGVLSNATLIITVAKNKVFHSSGYLLMANLAAADLYESLCFLITGYTSVYWYHHRNYRVPLSTLDLSCFICFFGYNISVYSMLVICLNRFCGVVYFSKYQQLFSLRNTARIVICVYISAFLSCIPLFPGVNLVFYLYRPAIWDYFIDVHRAPWGEAIFLSFQTVAAVTVIAMVVFYALILRKLRKVKKVRVGTTAAGGAPSQVTREDVRLCTQFCIVTLIYVGSWVLLAVARLATPSLTTPVAHKIINCVNLLAWQLNFAINPLVYMLVNRRIRHYMTATLTLRDGATLTLRDGTELDSQARGRRTNTTGVAVAHV